MMLQSDYRPYHSQSYVETVKPVLSMGGLIFLASLGMSLLAAL